MPFPEQSKFIHLISADMQFSQHTSDEASPHAEVAQIIIDGIHDHVPRKKETEQEVNIKIAEGCERTGNKSNDRSFDDGEWDKVLNSDTG